MDRVSLDRGWAFVKGIPRTTVREDYIPGMQVDLPHDMQIGQETCPLAVGGYSTGYYEGCTGIYCKILRFSNNQPGSRYVVEFDGCSMETEVRLNGQVMGRSRSGYAPFLVDLTDAIRFGEDNYLMVIADNSCQPNSRWYSGAGLYRHVDLRSSGPVHIPPWGLYVHTEQITDGTAFVCVEVEMRNDTGTPCEARAEIALCPEKGGYAQQGNIRTCLPAGESVCARTVIAVEGAQLWTPEKPVLYTVEVILYQGDEICDRDHISFGIRTISVDPVNGLCLNGEAIKLHGGCLHHDNGLLGSVSYYTAEVRRVRILKENSYNAVRTAHNPPSRDLLEACDRLGMLVVDELFDCWINGKRLNDYGKWFEFCWEKDLESSVKRDRSHPCVIMWSIGNEIVERGGLSHGGAMARRIAEKVRRLDAERPVTSALNELLTGLNVAEREALCRAEDRDPEEGREVYLDSLWTEKTEAFAAALDVVGYNYLDRRYVEDGQRWPERIICGLESYPKDMVDIWEKVEQLPWVIGDFTWTCYDYLGEAGVGKSRFLNRKPEGRLPNIAHDSPYPWRTANCGDFDICGVARPQAALRRILWGSEETWIGVQDLSQFGKYELMSGWGFPELWESWTWPEQEGKPICVTVMSRSDRVRLLRNGVPVEIVTCGKERGYMTSFEMAYESGTLVAESLDGDVVVSRAVLVTAGVPEQVVLGPEQDTLQADGYDLGYVKVEIRDAAGRRVPGSQVELFAEVEGAATLAGFGSGAPMTEDNYASGQCFTYDGRALLILRTGVEPGRICVRVTSRLGTVEVELKARMPETQS